MKILVVLPLTEEHKKRLEAQAPDWEYSYQDLETITREQVQDAEIIIGNVPRKLLAGSANLKWIQLNNAGTDGYTEEGILPKDCLLTNATGAYGLAISEYMMGTLLMMMKKLDRYYLNQQQCLWKDEGHVVSVYGAKIMVVGLGDIGSEFAKRAAAFGAEVYGVKRHKTAPIEGVREIYTMDEMDEHIGKMDVVTSSLPGFSETLKVFNRDRFAKMKKSAYFVNVGRGTAVDSDALADALNSGHLAGAAVDVTDPEPLPADHPLWKAKNLVLTPHTSGQYHLPETFERIVGIATDNLGRFSRGDTLKNIIDFETGYCKHL